MNDTVTMLTRRADLAPASANRDDAPSLQSLDDLGRLQPDDIFKKLHWRKYGAEPAADLLDAFRELLLAPDGETTP